MVPKPTHMLRGLGARGRGWKEVGSWGFSICGIFVKWVWSEFRICGKESERGDPYEEGGGQVFPPPNSRWSYDLET